MKKTLLFFCAVLLFVLLFAFGASAAEDFDFTDATADESGEKWHWDNDGRILTLRSFQLEAQQGDAIRLPHNSTVYFSGECSVVAKDGNGIVTTGLLVINGTGEFSVTATGYGVDTTDTVLFNRGITVSGRRAAASGIIEADGGYAMTVSNGSDFVDEVYNAHKTVRTGELYPVYVTVNYGGGASFYAGMFAPGQTVVLSARPQYGFALKTWQSPYVELDDPEAETVRFKMPKKPVRVYGTFERAYRVTVPKTEGGHVELLSEGELFFPGDQVILYAVPDTGYYFSHWTSDYGRFRDPLQAYAALTMPSIDATLTPVFVKGESYYLKVEKIGEGTTNIELGNFPQDKSILLRATPAQGYVFSGWLSEAGHFLSSTDEQTFFTMPGENTTVTAVFSLMEEFKKELTVNSLVGGTVNVTGGLYAPGMPISLKAEPKTGYRFVGWTIEPAQYADALMDPEFAETELLMPMEAVTISARFELLDPEAVTFYLSIGESEGGTVHSEGGGEYLAGYEIELSATPDEGYYFAGWKSAVGGKFDNAIDANTIFYMPANDTRITATFSKIIDPGANPSSPGSKPMDPSDADVEIEKRYVSFTVSLILCGLLAAGGTVYAEFSRKAAALPARRRRAKKRRDVGQMRPKRRL